MDALKEELPKKQEIQTGRLLSGFEDCLFAQTPDASLTVGVVATSEPSSLALLAAGVVGIAARRARRERTNK